MINMSERILIGIYPENDYRDYLAHSRSGKAWKSHKYISRKKGKHGQWVYKYATSSHGGGESKTRSVERGIFKNDTTGGSGRMFIRNDQTDEEISNKVDELLKMRPYMGLVLNNKARNRYDQKLKLYTDEDTNRVYKKLGVDRPKKKKNS